MSEKPKTASLINVIYKLMYLDLKYRNISLETCKSYKQAGVFAFVCLLDLQLSWEIFPYFKLKMD